MSIVPRTGVLRKLYEDAQSGNEYKSSAFWQVWLQRAFWEEWFIVVCEYPPDDSRRRIDIVGQRYEESQHTLSSFVFHEVKRPDGSLRIVEEQALDAARLAIDNDNLTGVYAFTTLGTRFRTWFVDANHVRLSPLHGSDTFADRSQYIDADSPWAEEMTRTIETIKQNPPLRRTPIVPSQFSTGMSMGHWEEGTAADNLGELSGGPAGMEYTQYTAYEQDVSHAESTDYAFAPPYLKQEEVEAGEAASAQSYLKQEEVEAGESSSAQPYQQQQEVEAGESSSTKQRQHTASMDAGQAGDGTKYERVRVRVEKHALRPNEYIFQDSNGRARRTVKNEWDRIDYKGHRRWAYHGKRTTYISDIDIK